MNFLRQIGIAWLCALGTGCTGQNHDSRATALNGVQIPDLQKLIFSAAPVRSVRELKVEEFSAESKAVDVSVTRIENVAEEKARQLIQQKRFQVEGLYQEEKSPYPGFLSKTVKCAKEFLPVIQAQSGVESDSLRVEAAANSRKILGVCNDSEMRYHAVSIIHYCKKAKLLLQIDGYLPKEDAAKAKAFMKDVSC